MVTKRIIPCLDIRNGKVVKGVKFQGIKEVADPLEQGKIYNERGADELVFYDITASIEGRGVFLNVLKSVASNIFIPLTVGGGINKLDDFARVLGAGADKVSINTGAINNPNLIEEAASKYGNQCVVLSMDVKLVDGNYHIFRQAGQVDTGIDAIQWAIDGVERGAGEIVVNSIDMDGVRKGFDVPMLSRIQEVVDVPVIASGGAGGMDDFVDLFNETDVSAGLAAGIFHSGEVDILELKKHLVSKDIEVRI